MTNFSGPFGAWLGRERLYSSNAEWLFAGSVPSQKHARERDHRDRAQISESAEDETT
jgi:hypothetical protein